MGLFFRRRYKVALPYDAEVEFLESTGDQYINTVLKPLNGATGTIRIQVKGVITNYVNDTYRRTSLVCCFRPINPYKGFIIGRNRANDANKVFYIWGNNTEKTEVTSYGNIFTLDETHSLDNQSHNYSLHLFCYEDNVGRKDQYRCKAKLYYCKISINNIVVADLIPVRKDNVGYMYDKVSERLFGNNGAGALIIGPDVNRGGGGSNSI